MVKSFFYTIIIACSFFACEKPGAYLNGLSTLDEFKSPALSKVSVYDTLPEKVFQYVSLHQLNGIKVTYPTGRSTTYFELEGEPASFLRAISTLPFSKNQLSDTFCRRIDVPFSLSGKKVLTDQEVTAAAFFWEIDPSEFIQYECLKGNQRHTILISNKTRRILHRIEATV